MIYLWDIPDNYPEYLIGDYDRDKSPDRFLFKEGEQLPADVGVPTIKFGATVKELDEIDDLANNAMVPLVSSRVAILLNECAASDIQLIDAIIEAKDGILTSYKLVNITSKIVGIDKVASKFTLVPDTDKIMSFRYLKYKEDCMKDHVLARDAEYSSNLLVSDAFANKLLVMKLVGVGLYNPEEMNW